jgi:hypothetical protein
MAIDTAPFSRRRPGDTTCCPLNATLQRPATASPSTDGDTTDFYGPINLAKALTSRAARPPYPARLYPFDAVGRQSFAVFAIANGKQKLTISQLLQHNIADGIFCGPACSLPSSFATPLRPSITPSLTCGRGGRFPRQGGALVFVSDKNVYAWLAADLASAA